MLAGTAFVRKALRSAILPAGAAQVSVFCGLAFALYAVLVVRAAWRGRRVPPEEARADLLRVAGAGFLLAYFALEMS